MNGLADALVEGRVHVLDVRAEGWCEELRSTLLGLLAEDPHHAQTPAFIDDYSSRVRALYDRIARSADTRAARDASRGGGQVAEVSEKGS